MDVAPNLTSASPSRQRDYVAHYHCVEDEAACESDKCGDTQAERYLSYSGSLHMQHAHAAKHPIQKDGYGDRKSLLRYIEDEGLLVSSGSEPPQQLHRSDRDDSAQFWHEEDRCHAR